MSDTLRIALVAEGVTDYVVLRAVVESMLGTRSFDMKLLQPEGSVAFTGSGDAGPLGGGWKGVHKWCLQAVQRSGGDLSYDPLFMGCDVLILHLDADVAAEDPANWQVPRKEFASQLPCERPCPPSSDTTDSLRKLMLHWAGETLIPPKTVLCIPSKSMEAWIVAIFFPDDREMIKKGWECHPRPETRLGKQPTRSRFDKSQNNYQSRSGAISSGWPEIATKLEEAKRFRDDFIQIVSQHDST